jgi:galactonate dehydratase
MTASGYIESVKLHQIAVSHRTTWFVTEISTADGVKGLGECSDLRDPEAGRAVISAITPFLSTHRPGEDIDALDRRITDHLGRGSIPGDSFLRRLVVGSLMTALCDIAARTDGLPLHGWLGAPAMNPVPLYANINRAPVKRRSDEFAAVAVAAVTAGFDRIKLAPFDGPAHDASSLLETGLAHLRAVRAAVGPGPTVYVDLHHRLGRPELLQAIEAMEQLDIGWIEDAVDVLSPADLLWLRETTDIPLAGGEKLTDPADVAAVAGEGLLSYLLLDPKYVGGPLRMRSVLEVVGDMTVTFHDPTSPVSTGVSAHLAALPEDFAHVEYAFGEPIDRRILLNPAEEIANGELTLLPGPGIGASFDPSALGDRISTREWHLPRQEIT